MFSFFKKKTTTDLSFLATDMHSHLIPGIDDGAKTMEESILLIRQLKNLGYKKIITTPHIMGEYYPNTPATILSGMEAVKSVLEKEQLDIEFEAAAEYYVDEYFMQQLKSEESFLTFSGQKLLIEFPMLGEVIEPQSIIFDLRTRNYEPILAHPERYLYYADRFDVFEQLRGNGCQLQVNLLSLTGHYGIKQKKLGIRLLNAGLVDYLGTDLHRKSHLNKLKTLSDDRVIRKLLANGSFLNKEL